jgi:hypothetical protein
MKRKVNAGVTSLIERVFIRNTSTTSSVAGLTGLTYSSSGLTLYYCRAGDTSSTAVTLSAGTLGTWSSGGFVAVDGTNMPGVYEIGIPNAAVASGKPSVAFVMQGATNMEVIPWQYELDAVNYQDGVRFGLTSLPNATAAASGGLPTVGTGTGQVNPDGTGAVPVAFGTALPTTPTANSVGEVLMILDYLGGRFGTAQAGAASTITLDSGASTSTNAYVGDGIVLYGGTGGGVRGTGQRRTITAYNTSSKVATVDRAWDTNPDNTSKFFTLPQAKTDVYLWNSSAPNALQSGRVDAYAGASAASLTFNLTGNITGNLSGSVGSVTGAVTVGTNNDKTGYSLATAPPTATAIATAVLTDTTSGDLATAGSLGHLVTTAPSWYTAPTTPPTAAAIATAVLTDTTSGDLATTGSVGHLVTTAPSWYTTPPTAGSIATAVMTDVSDTLGADIAAMASTISTNLDAKMSTRSTFSGGAVASVTAAVTVGTNNDKTGYVLAATGLDSIPVTDPGGVSNWTTFPKCMLALYRRFLKPTALTSGTLTLYKDDAATVNATQTVSDNGTTQIVGKAT